MAFTRNGRCEYCLKNCTTTVTTSRFEYYALANRFRCVVNVSQMTTAEIALYGLLLQRYILPYMKTSLLALPPPQPPSRPAALTPTTPLRAQGGTKAAPRREGEQARDAFAPKASLAECRQFLKAAARDPAPLLKVGARWWSGRDAGGCGPDLARPSSAHRLACTAGGPRAARPPPGQSGARARSGHPGWAWRRE
jgi:hypothetical protein